MSEPDFAALGLLDGLVEPARTARAELLAALHADGVPVAELAAAVAEGRLALLPAERAVGGVGGTLTAREIARRAGVELAALEAVRRACGLAVPAPDEPVLGALDLAAARTLAAFLAGGLPLDGLIEASRVFGEATARAAAAAATLANTAIPRPGDTEQAYGLRLAAAARDLTPPAEELLGLLYRLHTRDNLRLQMVDPRELAAGRRSDVHDISVAFCDLVGFTGLGERVPAADLGAIATRFVQLAAALAVPPVRLVKTLGDAVMLVAPEPAALLDATLALLDAAAAEGPHFPAVHAGAAHGPALRRSGDYYGEPVNLAARLAERARAGTLLGEGAIRAGARDFAWAEAGVLRLKGVHDPVPVWRCVRGGARPVR